MLASLIISILVLTLATAAAAYAWVASRERQAILRRVQGDVALGAAVPSARPITVSGIAPEEGASEKKKGAWTRLMAWLEERMPATSEQDEAGRTEDAPTLLLHAGFDRSAAPAIYFIFRVASAACLPLLALPFAPTHKPWVFFVLIGAAFAVGVFAPPSILAQLARRRQEALRRALPDSMDLLVVCVEAGISLDAAILRVGREMAKLHPALAKELLLVNRRVNAGMPREQALHGLAARTGLDELRGLASNMIQSERWGTSIATVLRVYAESLRVKRKQAAEKRAATAPLKMLFPLGVCIFPSIFIVIVGPAAIKIYAMFVNH